MNYIKDNLNELSLNDYSFCSQITKENKYLAFRWKYELESANFAFIKKIKDEIIHMMFGLEYDYSDMTNSEVFLNLSANDREQIKWKTKKVIEVWASRTDPKFTWSNFYKTSVDNSLKLVEEKNLLAFWTIENPRIQTILENYNRNLFSKNILNNLEKEGIKVRYSKFHKEPRTIARDMRWPKDHYMTYTNDAMFEIMKLFDY